MLGIFADSDIIIKDSSEILHFIKLLGIFSSKSLLFADIEHWQVANIVISLSESSKSRLTGNTELLAKFKYLYYL